MGIEVLDLAELGWDELVTSGISRARPPSSSCACAPASGSASAGRRCRSSSRSGWPTTCGRPGVELDVDQEAFVARRRVKTEAQLDGIRRAQAAADAAMGVAARMIRELPDGLTSEAVRKEMQMLCDARGCDLADDVIVSHGPQGAVGHEPGHGPIGEGESVIVDIWPRDRASRCWSDMTRTFVAGGGEPTEELAEYWQLTREALDRSFALVRAGADCREIYDGLVRAVRGGRPPDPALQAAGARRSTRATTTGSATASASRCTSGPNLGRTPDTLVAGDVITLEPGIYRKEFGGVRLEDLVLVGEDGAELLTDFPYDL